MLSAEHRPRFHVFLNPRLPMADHLGFFWKGPSSPSTHIEHIWIITGPAGCGKTTVAQYLARELSVPYVEGDDVSSTLNPGRKQLD